MKKYIGIKNPQMGKTIGKNIGLIFEKREDGLWYCIQHPDRQGLQDWHIESDVMNGYLKEYNEKTEL